MSIETLKTFLQNLDLALLLKDPSAFFLDYGVEISNLQVAVIVGIISLFIIELKIKHDTKKYQKKSENLIDFEETSYESNEISSNPVTQKIEYSLEGELNNNFGFKFINNTTNNFGYSLGLSHDDFSGLTPSIGIRIRL